MENGIGPGTEVYCVIGNPVGHSLSPLMQNRAFRVLGRNAVYVAFAVGDVAAAVTGVRGLGLRGVSVTIPHKLDVMAHLDAVDPVAEKIGAVNTLAWRDGRLWGFNTDCTGALRALEEKTEIRGKNVLVIGAGGAARAVGFGLCAAGATVTVANRTAAAGERLAEALSGTFVPLKEIAGRPWDIVINTTSVGMTPHEGEMPAAVDLFRSGMVVMDIVYNPLETLFLRRAVEAGCTVIDGLSMFVYQGACQFEMWTGEKAPVAEMRRVVYNRLAGR